MSQRNSRAVAKGLEEYPRYDLFFYTTDWTPLTHLDGVNLSWIQLMSTIQRWTMSKACSKAAGIVQIDEFFGAESVCVEVHRG